jgi:hypothetical protein
METETITNQENQEVTGTTAESQVERGFTQEEVNRIVADRVERERKKYESKYSGVDIEHYQQLAEAEEARKIEDQKKRGEFENILKDTVSKKDSVINQLQSELKSIKVDGALLNAASSLKAVNPDQVVRLLKDQVRLGDSGSVEVVDPATGQIRYTDSGDAFDIKSLVNDFLQANPHFVAATPKGSGTVSNTNSSGQGKLDVSKLDMTNPEHRELYKQYRKERGLA